MSMEERIQTILEYTYPIPEDLIRQVYMPFEYLFDDKTYRAIIHKIIKIKNNYITQDMINKNKDYIDNSFLEEYERLDKTKINDREYLYYEFYKYDRKLFKSGFYTSGSEDVITETWRYIDEDYDVLLSYFADIPLSFITEEMLTLGIKRKIDQLKNDYLSFAESDDDNDETNPESDFWKHVTKLEEMFFTTHDVDNTGFNLYVRLIRYIHSKETIS